jgi:hypothetical protein
MDFTIRVVYLRNSKYFKYISHEFITFIVKLKYTYTCSVFSLFYIYKNIPLTN